MAEVPPSSWRAEAEESRRRRERAGGSTNPISINPNYITHSDVEGVDQVAIRGDSRYNIQSDDPYKAPVSRSDTGELGKNGQPLSNAVSGDVKVFYGSKAERAEYLKNPRAYNIRKYFESVARRSADLEYQGYNTPEYIIKGRPTNVNNSGFVHDNRGYDFLGRAYNVPQTQKESGFEARTTALIAWENAAENRKQRVLTTFGYTPDGSYWRNAGAYALAAPTLFTIGFAEGALISGAKASWAFEGLTTKGYSPYVKQELWRAAKETPGAAVQSYNPQKPEGLVNLALLVSPLAVKGARGITYINKEYIPAEKIIEAPVLSGEQTFPYKGQTPSGLKGEFLKSEYQIPIKSRYDGLQGGFHGSENAIGLARGVGKGSSATPGLYIAPSLSKYFLKIKPGGIYAPPSFSIIPRFNKPTIQYMNIQRLDLIPESYVKTGSVSGMNRYFTSQEFSGSGRAAISPEYYLGKPESEAIIAQNSKLSLNKQGYNWWDKLTGFKQYSKVDGSRVPIRVINVEPNNAGLFTNLKSNLELKNIERLDVSNRRYYDNKPSVSLSSIAGSGFGYVNRPLGGGVSRRTYNPQDRIRRTLRNVPPYRPEIYNPSSQPPSRTPYRPTRTFNPSISRPNISRRPSITYYIPRAPPTRRPPIIPIPNIKGLKETNNIRDYGAWKITKYFPSFSALFFKIRGRYKKGKLSQSGQDFRPITSSGVDTSHFLARYRRGAA